MKNIHEIKVETKRIDEDETSDRDETSDEFSIDCL
jgi:hypothetical protein